MHDSLPVNRAFSTQSAHYDEDDRKNRVLTDLRLQVYQHLGRHLKPQSTILELNAGTGIDASWMVSKGHEVLATDLSDGMIRELNKKAEATNGKLSVRQISYDRINELNDRKFDYIFSNFGGLNCIQDLSSVTRHLSGLLSPGGMVTFVVMPVVCPWELISLLKGNKHGVRRLRKGGVSAHIDGHYFQTYYFSFSHIRRAFGNKFELIEAEGLAAISPPPHRPDFPERYPGLYQGLRKLDRMINHTFPFNRWADHVIVTFRLR